MYICSLDIVVQALSSLRADGRVWDVVVILLL